MIAARSILGENVPARWTARIVPDPFVPLLVLGTLAVFGGCQWQGEEARVSFSWERMIDQKKYDAFEPADMFPDGKVMRTPPEGTLHREAPDLPVQALTGRAAVGRAGTERFGAAGAVATAPAADSTGYVSRVPLVLAMADLRRGRERFDIFCAVCHGIDGSGASRVATYMSLRPPPPLVGDPVRSFPPGRIYETITEGYGLMPSYAAELPVADRWRVVSYVEALQLAQRARVDSLPPQVRAEVLRELENGGGTFSGTGSDTVAPAATRPGTR